MRRISLLSLAVVLMCAIGSSGCAGSGPGNVDEKASEIQSGGNNFGVSRVNGYQNLESLRADSSAAVIATVLGPSDSPAGPVPATNTKVAITKVLWGSVGGASEIVVHQLGTATVRSSDVSPLLQVHRSYLLYVAPFYYTRGVSTGMYIITGDQAEYELKGSVFTLVSPIVPGSAIPQEIPASSALSIVSG